ncbi:MAG: phenylalanine--tRNA ligase subunit beta [Chloroflexi bacterium]|nr:phenylalanine--tRNA ligase subunit beta [Chloroflexota bacterium]
MNRLLGTALEPADQRRLLEAVGIEVLDAPAGPAMVPVALGDQALEVPADGSELLVALIPGWRRDLAIEADIAEEIARIHGYDRIPGTLPDTTLPEFRPSPLELRDGVRGLLAGAGLHEVATHALVAPSDLERAAWSSRSEPAEGEEPEGGHPIVVTNPLSADHSVLRQGLLGSLLDVVGSNQRRGRTDIAVFEIGKGYGRVESRPREWWRLGFALVGSFDRPAWSRPARDADLDDAKGILEVIARHLGFEAPVWTALTDEPLLHPGRVGELDPRTAAAWDLRGRVVVAEVSIRGLSVGTLPVPRAVAPSRYPDVERDLAVVAHEDLSSASLAAIIAAAAGPLLRAVRLFDVYRGANLPPDARSLAFRLRFSAGDRTLTEPEIDGAMAAVTNALEAAGGRIRS